MTGYGHVCVSNSKAGFTAQVIKFFTRSKWSHSFVISPPLLNKDMVIESASNGVSIAPFDQHYRNDIYEGYRVYEFKCEYEFKDSALTQVFAELEGGYGFLEIPWFGWRALNKLFGRDIRHKDNWSQAGVICSELATQYITACGFGRLFSAFGKGSVNAQDIYEICESHPELFKLIESKE